MSIINIPLHRETTIIDAKIDDVWSSIRSATFEFLSNVKSTEIVPRDSSKRSVGINRKIIYHDGTSQLIQITEVSQLTRSIAYSIISSEPSISYTSANHEISLIEVTNSDQTFIEWTTNFSNDASLEVIEDSRFKKKEGFKDLKEYLSMMAKQKKLIEQNGIPSAAFVSYVFEIFFICF